MAKTATKHNTPDLSTATMEELQAEILRLQTDLTAAKTVRVRASAVPKTDEEKAEAARKAAGKVSFETFNYASEHSDLGKLQLMGRNVHIYAFYKVIKFFSYDRLSRVLYDLCVEAGEIEGKTTEQIIQKVTSRTPKTKAEVVADASDAAEAE